MASLIVDPICCIQTTDVPTEASPAIPETLYDGLDPEWVKLWNDHGRYQKRADEVSIEIYRKDPAAYSFTYATWPGRYHEVLSMSCL
jgi:hypothetical protein